MRRGFKAVVDAIIHCGLLATYILLPPSLNHFLYLTFNTTSSSQLSTPLPLFNL